MTPVESDRGARHAQMDPGACRSTTLGEMAVPLAVLAIVIALITPLPASCWTC